MSVDYGRAYVNAMIRAKMLTCEECKQPIIDRSNADVSTTCLYADDQERPVIINVSCVCLNCRVKAQEAAEQQYYRELMGYEQVPSVTHSNGKSD